MAHNQTGTLRTFGVGCAEKGYFIKKEPQSSLKLKTHHLPLIRGWRLLSLSVTKMGIKMSWPLEYLRNACCSPFCFGFFFNYVFLFSDFKLLQVFCVFLKTCKKLEFWNRTFYEQFIPKSSWFYHLLLQNTPNSRSYINLLINFSRYMLVVSYHWQVFTNRIIWKFEIIFSQWSTST